VPKQLKVDEKKVYDLAYRGLSGREIAVIVGCDEKSLRNRYKKSLLLARAQRHLKLYDAQWQSAMAGNPAMLIWHGKNELGQTDKQEVKTAGDVKIEVVYRKTNANG
jgi:hypothetical protein